MEGTLRKIRALCAKDFPDIVKNPVMLVSSVIPLLLVFAFKLMYGDMASGMEETQEHSYLLSSFLLTTGVCMTAGMVPSMIVLYSMAEEKEKHTLRTLMLANVSGGQVLAAKAIVAMVITALVDVIIYFVVGLDLQYFALYLVISLVGTLPLVILSLLLGLLARDQMSSGLYSLPVILIALLPMFGLMSSQVEVIARYSPCGGMVELLDGLFANQLFTQEAIIPIVVTLAWTVAAFVLFQVFYKRFIRDN